MIVKWIMRYIQGTIGLKYQKEDKFGHLSVGYVDSYYAGDLDNRKSTASYVFTIAGGPLCYRSSRNLFGFMV